MLQCPECGDSKDPTFYLQVWVSVDNEAANIGDFSDMEEDTALLSDDQGIECVSCGKVGTVKEFTKKVGE